MAVWDAEHDNLREALDWLIETDSGEWALRLGTALFPFWERREHLGEGRERLKDVLKLRSTASPTSERARAAWYAAILADKQGDFTDAIRWQQESLDIYRALGDAKAWLRNSAILATNYGWPGRLPTLGPSSNNPLPLADN